MARIYGYLRNGQNDITINEQLEKLNVCGANRIYQEKYSAIKSNSSQLARLMKEVRDGDTLVVTGLDSLAHNTKHLCEVVESLKNSGIRLQVIDSGIDTSGNQGVVLCTLLAAIVDFEQKVVKERQSVGIARAKREGRYKGRKPTAMAKATEVLALSEQGLTRQKIADKLGIGVASVYRILKVHSKPNPAQRKLLKKQTKKPVKKQQTGKSKPTAEKEAEQLSFF